MIEIANALMEETKTVETRWFIKAPYNEDCYNVYVVRYTSLDGKSLSESKDRKSEYLDSSGHWNEFPEGSIMGPALMLSGMLIHTLSSFENLISGKSIESIEKQLNVLATDIVYAHLTAIQNLIPKVD